MSHQWIEDVGHCVCCWMKCTSCRQCKCQVENHWLHNGLDCPGPRVITSRREGTDG